MSGVYNLLCYARRYLQVVVSSPVWNTFRERASSSIHQVPLIIERMEVDLVFSRLHAKHNLRIMDIGAHHVNFWIFLSITTTTIPMMLCASSRCRRIWPFYDRRLEITNG